jgi:hypothetical protein
MFLPRREAPKLSIWLPLACAAIFVAGCSSVPEPVAELASARTAVRSVQDTDARSMAPVLLDRAKTKLDRAEAAMANKQYDEARRLAEESLADAQLARAKSDAMLAQRNADELEASIKVLRSEIDRARPSM